MADIKVIVAVVAALLVGAVIGGLIGHFAVPSNDPVRRACVSCSSFAFLEISFHYYILLKCFKI